MKKLVVATNNKNKLIELKNLLGTDFELQTLESINCFEDIPETSDTIEGNAFQKAEYVYKKYNCNVLADDTGLEVEALNGEPGVYSARYAGPNKNAEANMDLLLKNLEGKGNRNARFKTCLSLILDGKSYEFIGISEGTIRSKKSGTAGFGYDPIFEPKGFDITFAEMTIDEKNKISHRGRALMKFIEFSKVHF